MKHTTASGSHSPDIVQEKQRSKGYWFLSLNYTYWSLETSAATRRPLLHHYEYFGNLSAFLLYIFCLFIWEGVLGEPQRTIPCASHGLLNRFDSVNARGSYRIFQSDTSILPCLSGLFPLSDPWYSSHRRHIGRLRPNFAPYTWPLVDHVPHRYSVGD